LAKGRDRDLLPTLANPDGAILTLFYVEQSVKISAVGTVFHLTGKPTMPAEFTLSNGLTFCLTTKEVEQLKQKARALKKEFGIPHHQALDLAAKTEGLHHWKHVCESSNLMQPTEKTFYFGIFLSMNWKESSSLRTYDGVFIPDQRLEYFCKQELREYLECCIDYDEGLNRPFKASLSEREFNEFFSEWFEEKVFFRLDPDRKIKTFQQVLRLHRTRSMWPPQFIWIQGERYSL